MKGGSLGYDVIMARYRQHFLIFNLVMLAIMAFINSQIPDPPEEDTITALVSGTVVVILGIMAVWQYWMDGYAIKHLRIKEKKLFGK